jgi:hypothetical protein
MTLGEVEALREHWTYQPPVEAVLAAYFELPQREDFDEVPEMSPEAAAGFFGGVFASMSDVGH